MDKLGTSTAEAVIECLKNQFARHGVPDILVSDNACQFTAHSFKKFTKAWLFNHETISPGNSQANGAAEAAVKIIKRLWRKCAATGEDPLIGLLNIRNSPTEGLDTSPAQRLFGRRTKSMLPTTESKLTPHYPFSASEAWKKQEKRLRRQDHGKDLKHLAPGDNVRIQPLRPYAREWREATVTKKLTGRSYEVETDDGRKYRRTRQFLRQTPHSTHSYPHTQQPTSSDGLAADHPQQQAEKLASPTRTSGCEEETPAPTMNTPRKIRSGRTIRKPVRYRED